MPKYTDQKVLIDAANQAFMLEILQRSRSRSPVRYRLTKHGSKLVMEPNKDSLASSRRTSADLAASLGTPDLTLLSADGQRQRLDDELLGLVKHPQVLACLASPARQPTHLHQLQEPPSIHLDLPQIFASICLCDLKLRGHPIALSSPKFELGARGLRVGECEFLNMQSGGGSSSRDDCTITASPCEDGDGDGRGFRFVLEHAVPLVGAEGGRLAFVMAAQMDVTALVLQLREHATSGPQGTAISLPAHIVEDLAELVRDVRFFHQEAFVLGRSAGAGGHAWAMQWVAPGLFSSGGADLRGKLCCSDAGVQGRLAAGLAGEQAFNVRVRWGTRGLWMRMYCVPLRLHRGGARRCWGCFVVDDVVPDLWRL